MGTLIRLWYATISIGIAFTGHQRYAANKEKAVLYAYMYMLETKRADTAKCLFEYTLKTEIHDRNKKDCDLNNEVQKT